MPETVEIQMPQMGESVTEGTVLEWHKREGEFVEEGETVVEVSTDKVDAEVPAPASGVIASILKGEDETIEVGGVLGVLDPSAEPSGDGAAAGTSEAGKAEAGGPAAEGGSAGASGEAAVQASEPAAPVASQPAGDVAEGEASGGGVLVQLVMPEMGESVTEGTVLEWHKREGEAVAEGETVVEISTDKVDAEVPAPASGTIAKILAQPDETVQVGQVLAEMSASPVPAAATQVEQSVDAAAEAAAPAPTGADGGRASPVARRIAAASGVDLKAVRGSGPGGKVTKADVLAATDGGQAEAPAGPAPSAPRDGAAAPTRLRGPAAMLAQAMNESRSVPTATSFRTLAVDVLDAKRRALNAALKERGMKVSFTHLIAWAIVEAAREWSVMGRAYAESDGKPEVIEPGAVNLGIAVDVERKDGSRSLMVPCIKGADRLDFAAFHASYEELINKTPREHPHGRRLPGDHHHPDQSRGPRDRRLRAAAVGGPGDDRRHRLDRLPAGMDPRARRQAELDGGLEGDDDDLHLRSPDHPGRRVGLVPAKHRPAPPGRGLFLRVGCRVAWASPPRSSPPPIRLRPPRPRSLGGLGLRRRAP